jgi:hypothetical protein
MIHRFMWRRLTSLFAIVLALSSTAGYASAGTTGTISGTITDATTGKPLTGASVTAASPSLRETSTTNDKGFFVLQALSPDTYVVSVSVQGYDVAIESGVTVVQDQSVALNLPLSKHMAQIGRVTASSPSNLVKASQGTDVYSVSGQQLEAATGGDGLHKTIHQFLQTVPGITSNGMNSLPRIRGGASTDTGYEFDGIPIRERITGFFTTNLSSIGFKNVEVYTGGLSAANSGNGTGIINSVVKTGTYPGSAIISTGMQGPDYNHDLTIEYGGATRDGRFSWYAAFDGTGARPAYDYGRETFPMVTYGGYNGPGYNTTRDLLGNFHYRPTQRDDIQFLIQNGLGEFNYDYLLANAHPLAFAPCPGNVASKTSPTGFAGGTAPNGGTCNAGFYFQQLQPGQGNIWHHYSGLGKLQWTHLLNDTSSLTLRFAENFNQYIFDQQYSDANLPAEQSQLPAGCPAYPYASGTPVVVSGKSLCSNQSDVFYGDRRSNIYLGSIDYTTSPNAVATFKAGIGNEIDQNLMSYYVTNAFNSNGSWPNNYLLSAYPTSFPYAYIDASITAGRFVFDPGVRYSQGHYAFPGGKTVEAINPTLSGTYRINNGNVLRYSYGTTSNFIGTAYVYRAGGGTYANTQDYSPQLTHSADFQWEHDFDRSTSMRVGPYIRTTNNYYALYRPYLGVNSSGVPIYGPTQPTTAGQNQDLGAEIGINHVDPRPVGLSWYLAGDYNNYWTTSVSNIVTGSFSQSQVAADLAAKGFRVRSPYDPLFNGSLTLDWRLPHGFEVMPFATYQLGTFYNVYTPQELHAPAQWLTNLTLRKTIRNGKHEELIGVRVSNLFNNNNDVAPCQIAATGGYAGTGCSPFVGPQSGITAAPNSWVFQNYSQSPREYEAFMTMKF